MRSITPERNLEKEKQIPTVWRALIVSIIEAIKLNDNKKLNSIKNIKPITDLEFNRIQENIKGYGATLDFLPANSWDTSIYIWMDGYWDALIDLYTIEEGASDLSLSLRIRHSDEEYLFEIISVHVE